MHLDQVAHLGFDATAHLMDGLGFDDYEKAWFDAIGELKKFRLIDSEDFLNRCLDEGKQVLAEGAQGTLLDVDFGSYPFVTSSNTISAGVCAGLGISPGRIGKIYGVFKAYCTRVGSGPFPTELFDQDGDALRKGGNEFGSTTGRPRRCGWLDLPALRYAIMLNGIDRLIMMKADVLNDFPMIRVCTGYRKNGQLMESFPYDLSDPAITPFYEELKGWQRDIRQCTVAAEIPAELDAYIKFIEKASGVKVMTASVGPDRTQTLDLE
jgi:adenylosuccinate synthase